MSEREFRSQLLKMISYLKENSNKQINAVRKSIKNLDEKVNKWKRNLARKWKL
jgi:hypothetical protein